MDQSVKYLQHRGAICEPISSTVSWHCVSIITGGRDMCTLHSNWFWMPFSMGHIFTNMQKEMWWIKQGCREFA